MSETPNILRLRKRHGDGRRSEMTVADGQRLVAAQSMRGALLAGLIVIGVFCLLWMMLTTIVDRYLPWVTVILGVGLGLAVRRAGRGLDWRFPAVAAVLALFGAFLSPVVLAAGVTADAEGAGTLQVLLNVTSMTWDVYYEEVFGFADIVFALSAACLAAFLANRKLTRDEYYALQLVLDERRKHTTN
jgi:hypothetical protein